MLCYKFHISVTNQHAEKVLYQQQKEPPEGILY